MSHRNPRERLAAIISLAEKKKEELEPPSVIKTRQAWRLTGMLGGAVIGANTAVKRGGAQTAVRDMMQGSEISNKYHAEDVAHELKKSAARGTEPPAWTQPQAPAGLASTRIDQLENGPIGYLRERSAQLRGSHGPVIDITPEVTHAAPAAEAAVKAAPKAPFGTRMKYAAEDAMHGTKKFLTRHSVGRNAAIGGLIGIGVGNYIGGVAGRELHRSQQITAAKARETRMRKQATEVAKVHATAKAIIEGLKRDNQLSAREELESIIRFRSREDEPNHGLRNAVLIGGGLAATGGIGYAGIKAAGKIVKAYRKATGELTGGGKPMIEAAHDAFDNIKNATAWSSDVGRLYTATGAPVLVQGVIKSAGHIKDIPSHFRQGLVDPDSANSIGGRIGRRLGRMWRSATSSFNSIPAGTPVRMSARDELSCIINLSTRDALNTILLAVDPRPRNSLGMFGSDEPGLPSPGAMQLTYGRAAGLGATAGAAGVGGGMGMKALIEKIKSMKKKK